MLGPREPIGGLTSAQAALADTRASCLLAAGAVLDERTRATTGGVVSIRQLPAAAKQAGTAAPDWRAERDMVRAAGFGRLATSGVLGDWDCMVGAADEAARRLHETIDLRAVSRHALAWCLADRPDDHVMAAILRVSRDIMIDDVHTETPERPYYRRTLDHWASVLAAPTG
ncbi:MAG TPA: hypothetical protein PLT40_18535 [Ilumatobacteraceae bacterium]|nr:hypothetical protein [Ilumatobacteraceae bacterium]HRA86333.1 hypothetical protein [Ilumatobacteraceae bacterium]